MNNSPLNANSDFAIEQTELENQQNFIKSPLMASICAAICVFSSIIALFFGVWRRLATIIFEDNFANSIFSVYSESSEIYHRRLFLNLMVLSIASFAGYLFIGSLNKRIGVISLLALTAFAFLYMIRWLPSVLGFDFIPDFFYPPLIGNLSILDIPLLIWLFLSLLIIPLIYLIGSIKARKIPAWKWFVLVVVPVVTFIFGLLPPIFFSIIQNSPFIGDVLFNFLTWGMFVWILFSLIIFSELIRTKVNKSYIWLTLILSTGAVVFSIIIISSFSFYIYQRAIEYKKLTTEEMRKAEIAVLLDRTF